MGIGTTYVDRMGNQWTITRATAQTVVMQRLIGSFKVTRNAPVKAIEEKRA